MQNAVRALIGAAFVFSSVWLASPAGAATDLWVQIQGESAIPGTCSAGNCTADLSNANGTAKTYSSAGITIAGADGTNPARVVTADSTQDELRLENALITTTSGPNTKYIYFWAQFSASDNTPSAPPLGLVRWERSAQGAMIRGAGAPPGNWTQVHGLISGDPISTATKKTVLPGCSASACGVFTFAAMKKTEDDYSLTGSRELRGELQFYMSTAGDQVKIEQHYVKSVAPGTVDDELKKSGIEDVADDDEACILGRKAGKGRGNK